MRELKRKVNILSGFYIDFERCCVCVNSESHEEIHLTQQEIKILRFLCLQSDNENEGYVTNEQIFEYLYGRPYRHDGSKPDLNNVTKAMSKLRSKSIKDGGVGIDIHQIIESNRNGSFRLSLIESPFDENQHSSSTSSPSELTSQGIFLFEDGKFEEAFELFKQAATLGEPEGQYMLGYCYRFGKGVRSDHFQAVKWFQKSANQGNPNAQHFLGICYDMGQGVEQNYNKAFELQSLAAQQGHADAQYNVGWYYYYGKGVEKNIELAIESMEKADNMGCSIARNSREYMLNPNITFDYEEDDDDLFSASEAENDPLTEKYRELVEKVSDSAFSYSLAIKLTGTTNKEVADNLTIANAQLYHFYLFYREKSPELAEKAKQIYEYYTAFVNELAEYKTILQEYETVRGTAENTSDIEARLKEQGKKTEKAYSEYIAQMGKTL